MYIVSIGYLLYILWEERSFIQFMGVIDTVYAFFYAMKDRLYILWDER